MRLFIRLATASGSRTIISNDLNKRDAAECASALNGAGIMAHTYEDVAPISLEMLVKRRAQADKKAAKRIERSNLVKFQPMKGKPHAV